MKGSNLKRMIRSKYFWPALYAIYLAFILISLQAFMAEDPVDNIIIDMDEKYTYDLTFPSDGKMGHYDIVRHDKGMPGEISLTYWTQDNKLDVTNVENIKTLEIDVQSIFEDESMKVFKTTSSESPNLHLDYWLEANDGIFTVEFDIASSDTIESLTFTKFPEPQSVRVNNQEWWKTETNYVKSGDKITISNLPTGKTTILIYFTTPNQLPTAAFTTDPAAYAGVNEEITFDGSTSSDTDGTIISWVWNFGDGNNDSGKQVIHRYLAEGVYTVRLTVRDSAEPFGESWVEKNITVAFGAEDDFDADGLRDIWEWNNFGDFDEVASGDPDLDRANNKAEHDAGTDPNDKESYPKEEGKEKETEEGDMTAIIIAVVVVVIILVLLLMVFRSKQAKEKTKEKARDEEAIAEMEAKIASAKELGLPTGEMEKLLKQAKGGKTVEVSAVKKKKSGRKKKGKGRTKGKVKGRTKGRRK